MPFVRLLGFIKLFKLDLKKRQGPLFDYWSMMYFSLNARPEIQISKKLQSTLTIILMKIPFVAEVIILVL
jgi:hypothetical protein